MDLMEDENDEDLTYLTFVSHKNGDGVHILCRIYSRKEQLWLSPLFCCLQDSKTLNNLKKHIYKLLFLNKSSYIVDCFVHLCVQIKDICK